MSVVLQDVGLGKVDPSNQVFNCVFSVCVLRSENLPFKMTII